MIAAHTHTHTHTHTQTDKPEAKKSIIAEKISDSTYDALAVMM
jgi:hypothetical protein